MQQNQQLAYSTLKETMSALAEFVYNNMDYNCSQIKQAEFNILYNEYHKALQILEDTGISESDAIAMQTKCAFDVPEEKYDVFMDWFHDRIYSMSVNQSIGFQNN